MATTTHEHSISDQLIALIRLQHIDSKIDQIKKLRGDLPDEIKDMEDEKEGLTTRVDNLKQELKDTGVSKKQAVTDVKDAEQLINFKSGTIVNTTHSPRKSKRRNSVS